MKAYVVQIATVIEGRQYFSGQIIRDLSEEEAKPYLKNKVIRADEDAAAEEPAVDAAPSALPPLATETKRVAAAGSAADKKASAAEEK